MPVLHTTTRRNPAALDENYPDTFEMDDTLVANNEDDAQQSTDRGLMAGVARHTLGLILLLFVVFLWTISNFLGSVGVITTEI